MQGDGVGNFVCASEFVEEIDGEEEERAKGGGAVGEAEGGEGVCGNVEVCVKGY